MKETLFKRAFTIAAPFINKRIPLIQQWYVYILMEVIASVGYQW